MADLGTSCSKHEWNQDCAIECVEQLQALHFIANFTNAATWWLEIEHNC